jgi:preprotein translocase subunit SecD
MKMKKIVLAIGIYFVTASLFVNYLYSQSDRPLISQADIDTLLSREQIRSYAVMRTEADLRRLINLAGEGGDVPEEFYFLVIQAGRLHWDNKLPNPERWDARATLSAFSSRMEVFDAIETVYREEIFSLLSQQRRGFQIILQADMNVLQERLGRQLTASDRNNVMQQTLTLLNNHIEHFGLIASVIRRQNENQIYVEIFGNAYKLLDMNSIFRSRGSLTFQIVDDETTRMLNEYYSRNPTTTFDAHGNLLNPSIIPADVVIRGVFLKDGYGSGFRRPGQITSYHQKRY